MTRLEKLVVTWRYWQAQTQAAEGTENWAEYHDQFLAAERELKDAADRLGETALRTFVEALQARETGESTPTTLQPRETVDGTGGGG